MKVFLTLGIILLASTARADITTQFTFGHETTNCYTVLMQDGAPSEGAICPSGFFGGGGLQAWLGHDPSNGGESVSMYYCSAVTLSDVLVPTVSEVRVDGVTCADVNYGYYTATWSGTLTYNYGFVNRRVCTGGRGQVCRMRWIRVFSDGIGTMSTPEPPPPPPQPITTTALVTLQPAVCDAGYTCGLNPADQATIIDGRVGLLDWQLVVNNADGTVDAIALETLSITPVSEEGDTYTAYGYGAIYVDGSWDPVKTFELNLSLVLEDEDDTGIVTVTNGTLVITTITMP